MSAIRGDAWRTRAQATVEFALVMPLFVLLLFSLIDFGRLEFGYISLTNAAREMARRAAIAPTCSSTLTPCNAANPPSSGSPGSDVTVSSNTVDQGFMNFQGFMLNPLDPSTDNLVITVYDSPCTIWIAQGNAPPCTSPHGSQTTTTAGTCTLPLDPTTCAVPTRFGLAGGSVDVVATYTFHFNPLFQNRLTGMIDASFMQQIATLSTTARAYIE